MGSAPKEAKTRLNENISIFTIGGRRGRRIATKNEGTIEYVSEISSRRKCWTRLKL
jgi:hypothetical protein